MDKSKNTLTHAVPKLACENVFCLLQVLGGVIGCGLAESEDMEEGESITHSLPSPYSPPVVYQPPPALTFTPTYSSRSGLSVHYSLHTPYDPNTPHQWSTSPHLHLQSLPHTPVDQVCQ
jgi:hypothetical protein